MSTNDITVTLDSARLGVSKALQWVLWQLVRCDLYMLSSSKLLSTFKKILTSQIIVKSIIDPDDKHE